MLKELQLSLYELFGYVLPGLISLSAVSIILWTVIAPASPLTLNSRSPQFWFVLTVLSYFFGHVAQGLGNVYASQFKSSEDVAFVELPSEIIARVRHLLEEKFKVSSKSFSPKWLYATVDEIVLQNGNASEREIFQYREGFYRGCAVSLILFAICVLLRTLVDGASVLRGQRLFPLSTMHLLTVSSLSIGCAVLMHNRYRRFGVRKVTNAILAFVALQPKL